MYPSEASTKATSQRVGQVERLEIIVKRFDENLSVLNQRLSTICRPPGPSQPPNDRPDVGSVLNELNERLEHLLRQMEDLTARIDL